MKMTKGFYQVVVNLGFGDRYVKNFRTYEAARIYACKQQSGSASLHHVYKEWREVRTEMVK